MPRVVNATAPGTVQNTRCSLMLIVIAYKIGWLKVDGIATGCEVQTEPLNLRLEQIPVQKKTSCIRFLVITMHWRHTKRDDGSIFKVAAKTRAA